MAAKKQTPGEPARTRAPATSPQSSENRMIALAVDLAEKQMSAGDASAQVITHYLKLGSSREKLEQRRIAQEIELLKIKQETLEASARIEDLYQGALDAMSIYKGTTPRPVDDVD